VPGHKHSHRRARPPMLHAGYGEEPQKEPPSWFAKNWCVPVTWLSRGPSPMRSCRGPVSSSHLQGLNYPTACLFATPNALVGLLLQAEHVDRRMSSKPGEPWGSPIPSACAGDTAGAIRRLRTPALMSECNRQRYARLWSLGCSPPVQLGPGVCSLQCMTH